MLKHINVIRVTLCEDNYGKRVDKILETLELKLKKYWKHLNSN